MAGAAGSPALCNALLILSGRSKHYFTNAEKVKKAAAAVNIEIIPAIGGFGYSAGILAHDPNLAEGLPVKNAPFVVKNGNVVLESRIALKNGGFEDARDVHEPMARPSHKPRIFQAPQTLLDQTTVSRCVHAFLRKTGDCPENRRPVPLSVSRPW